MSKEQSLIEMVAYKDTWGLGLDSYLGMLWPRLTLAKSLLTSSGVLVVHLDDHVLHYVKALADELFGRERFQNEVVWRRGAGHADARRFGRNHDGLLVYSKGRDFHFVPQFAEDGPEEAARVDRAYPLTDGAGRRYCEDNLAAAGPGPARQIGDRILAPPRGQHWRFSQERLDELWSAGRIRFNRQGTPRVVRYADETNRMPLQDIWTDCIRHISLATAFPTEKPEKLLVRVLSAFTNEGDLVADFFCGSGTTLAVAEKLARRWIGCDLGRFAIHTARKRLIGVQRELHAAGRPYRSFDVYNLGRYERQWWQKERLQGADQEHRAVVLKFFRAEPLTGSPSPLLHGRRGPELLHVDAIDGLFTRQELAPVVAAAVAAGAGKIACLAWEFEMDLRLQATQFEQEHGIKIRLMQIPREIMEANRTDPPPFFEIGYLQAQPVIRQVGQERQVDIKLTEFLPSLAEVPAKELAALEERALESGFDFIDFWAIDFDYRPGQPFQHHWQAYRTRKERALPTVSQCGFVYPGFGTYTACVKVIDVFGADTSTLVEVKVEA